MQFIRGSHARRTKGVILESQIDYPDLDGCNCIRLRGRRNSDYLGQLDCVTWTLGDLS